MKLIRITAWRMRLIWNLHWLGPHLRGPLHLFEIEWAVNTLVKLVQQECFHEELKALKKGVTIDKQSFLLSLFPFLDAQNIIRVGGRLQNSDSTWEQCFPIVLSSSHKFSKLLIQYEHVKHFHAGPQLLRSVTRRKFWVICLNRAIQSCIHRCHKCIRVKADTSSQMMAALPRSRIVPGRVFQVTGVDYFGPIKLNVHKVRRGRSRNSTITASAYVAVFVCLFFYKSYSLGISFKFNIR